MKISQFDYLLNAFERASQSNAPAMNGYAEKRKALIAYVRELELRPAPAPAPVADQICSMCQRGQPCGAKVEP